MISSEFVILLAAINLGLINHQDHKGSINWCSQLWYIFDKCWFIYSNKHWSIWTSSVSSECTLCKYYVRYHDIKKKTVFRNHVVVCRLSFDIIDVIHLCNSCVKIERLRSQVVLDKSILNIFQHGINPEHILSSLSLLSCGRPSYSGGTSAAKRNWPIEGWAKRMFEKM